MSLKKYLTQLKVGLTVCQFLVIGSLFNAGYSGSRQTMYSLLYCLLVGFSCGLIFCGITELFDWYPFESLTLSSDETNILNNEYNTIEISKKNLKDKQEIESAQKNICVWLIVSTVVWCTVFYVGFNY
jgi:hypothetical protein